MWSTTNGIVMRTHTHRQKKGKGQSIQQMFILMNILAWGNILMIDHWPRQLTFQKGKEYFLFTHHQISMLHIREDVTFLRAITGKRKRPIYDRSVVHIMLKRNYNKYISIAFSALRWSLIFLKCRWLHKGHYTHK